MGAPVAFGGAFASIKDPRVTRTRLYPLPEILICVMVGIAAGGRSWYEVESYCTELLPVLRQVSRFEHGVPSHDTLNRVFGLIDPDEFEKCFEVFVDWHKREFEQRYGSVAENGEDAIKRINIDGKTLRGASSASNKNIHMVTAWASDFGVSFGQTKVAEKSNEITAIPLILEMLDLKDCEVSIDAMGAQVNIVAQIHFKGGYYFIALKENQPTLFEEAQELAANYAPVDTAYEMVPDKGKVTEYTAKVFKVIKRVVKEKDRWDGLKHIIRVDIKTTLKKDQKVTYDTRYYIANSNFSAAHYMRTARKHWSIENDCHWQLDVTFGEDDSRKTGIAAENFSRATRLLLGAIRTMDFGPKLQKRSIKARCFALAHSPERLRQLF